MSAITPQTELRLLKCPLEEDNKHQLTFASAEAQYTYFNSLTNITADNFTYQRKDSIIRFPEHIDNLLGYNYVMYQNEAYTNKWFYAFITNMEYVNDHMTNITIKTDCFQTWQFDIVYKKSFVEREHVNDDTVGKHTVPEQLETGEYVCGSTGNIYTAATTTYIIIGATKEPTEIGFNLNKMYNGIFSGTQYLAFKSETGASNYLRAMDNLGIGDAVVNVFIAPSTLCGTLSWVIVNIHDDPLTPDHTITTEYAKIPKSTDAALLETSSNITSPATLNGYTPKNNKMFVFPYNYFYVSNNAGQDVEYHYEDFVSNTASFKTYGALTPGCSIRAYPVNYKLLTDLVNTKDHFNSGITSAKYPICSWNTDLYKNWATQNTLNLGFSVVGGATALIGATFLGGPVGWGMAASGLGLIGNTAKEYYKHSFTPPQANGNTNSGDVVFSAGKMGFPYFKMTIRSEYAEIIDNYFSTYGYKVNVVKLPNVTGRTTWNFVKTIDCNLEGNIPQADIDELKKMFNNGVTFWHSTTNFLNYSATNTIVT